MAINRVASRHSYLPLTGANTLTIESGNPVHVYGMKLTGGATLTTFTVKDADSTTLETIKVAGDDDNGSTLECSIPWIADNGVSVTADIASYVTVYHNSPGN